MELGRRALFGLGLAAAAGVKPARAATGLGEWTDGEAGLPTYRYTGPLDFPDLDPVRRARVPDDPWFLLGNDRLTLFAHASGRLRVLSGQRVWARLNGENGLNGAALTVDGAATPLIGMDAPAARGAGKRFHPGAAIYDYAPVGDVAVTRGVAVMPSAAVGAGVPAIVVTVALRNGGASARRCAYVEHVEGDYRPIWPPWSSNARRVRFQRSGRATEKIARIDTSVAAIEGLDLPPRPAMSEFDASPPTLWTVAGPGAQVTEADFRLIASASFRLAPGERRVIRFVLGTAFEADDDVIADLAAQTLAEAAPGPDGFAGHWARTLPAFADEPDPALRREMRWNAAVLRAMAVWREYYGEAVVAEGSTYDYAWGSMMSSRDVAQLALPLCTLDPALARSALRWLYKRTGMDGLIQLNDEGFGWATHGSLQTSDQQLWLFMLAAEYLRATGDASVLNDTIAYYPAEGATEGTGLAHLEAAFRFFRDRVGVGSHGLARLWNSDWNDMFYQWPKTLPYAKLFEGAESHMNTAVALCVLADLARELRRVPAAEPPRAAALADAMEAYRAALLRAFLADLGDRVFSRRAYLAAAGPVGEDQMWLEPQPFVLMLPEVPVETKRRLLAAVRERLGRGEAMGPKQMEHPPPQPEPPPGERENGGFWWALAGPLVLGVAGFDPARAEAMLRDMTFAHYARAFPEYWTGAFTASDSLDCATTRTEGLSSFQPWCAHAHAWPLYCYLKLRGVGAERPVP